jgi:hypothetical protein
VYTRPAVEDKVLEFGVSGKLLWNALLMYDRQTDSLWSHITGEAISGRLKGESLKVIPSVHTAWKEWRKAYPHTLVLSKGSRRYSSDPYEDYYNDPARIGISPQKRSDGNLPPKEYVVGIKLDTEARAFPFSYLEEHPVINDELAGRSLVIVFSREGKIAATFDRQVEGHTLTFKRDESPDQLFIKDEETGTLWHALTGEAVKGNLQGKKLRKIPHMVAFWFAWKDYFPETEIFPRKEKIHGQR